MLVELNPDAVSASHVKSFLTPSKDEKSKEIKLSVSKRRMSAALTESNSVRIMRNKQNFEN